MWLCYSLTWVFLPQSCRWISTDPVFPWSQTQVTEHISTCLADISQWMSAHHLKLNLDKTELLLLSGKASPIHDLSITIENFVVFLTWTSRNLGGALDDQLSFTANMSATTCSHRLILHNIRRKRPFFTLAKFSETAQLLHWCPVAAQI